MKISIDGGALCLPNNKRTGNLTFTENLLKALSLYDKKNNYLVYAFCQPRINNIHGSNIRFKKLLPKLGWMKWRVDIEEIVNNNDLFLALNQVSPLFGTKKIISFCHGLSYYFYPNLYPKRDLIRLNNQLLDMVKRSDKIIVSSIRIKDELLEIFPKLNKIEVIPFGSPLDMVNKLKVKSVKFKIRKKFFLFVGSNQPIKNTNFIIKMFKSFIKLKDYQNYCLYLVGDFDVSKHQNVKVIANIDRKKLKELYQKATGYLACSYYESFNFPVLEALSQGCPVIGLNSAIIPELKEFVIISDNKEKIFVEKMIKITKQEPHIDLEKLIQQFSWEKYVRKLRTLYE